MMQVHNEPNSLIIYSLPSNNSCNAPNNGIESDKLLIDLSMARFCSSNFLNDSSIALCSPLILLYSIASYITYITPFYLIII